jgi:hypothetical protein
MRMWFKSSPPEFALNPLLNLDQSSPRHKLSYLIALLLLWQLIPKYRNYINQAKISLLRASLNLDESQTPASCTVFETHYLELYQIACYYVSIHSAIHYKVLLQQQQFDLKQVRDSGFFPKTHWLNLVQLGKNSLIASLMRLIKRN